MEQHEILRLTKLANAEEHNGMVYGVLGADALEYFVSLIEAETREACAKVCEQIMKDTVLGASKDYLIGRDMGSTVCANRIRTRPNVELSGAAASSPRPTRTPG